MLLLVSLATFLVPHGQSVPLIVLAPDRAQAANTIQEIVVAEGPIASTTAEIVNPVVERSTGDKATSTPPRQAINSQTKEVGYQDLLIIADRVVACESGGRNIEILDTNGKMSRGIAMFQDTTWKWMSQEAGITGSSMEPEKAYAVLVWALKNGYGDHWRTCFRRATNS